MIAVVTNNTEEKMLEMLYTIKPNPVSFRCLQFSFSRLGKSDTDEIRTKVAINMIRDAVPELDGKVFVCADNDIFIIFRGNAKSIGEKLIPAMNKLAGDGDEDKNISQLFDLSSYWQDIFNICRDKIGSGKNSKATEQTKPEEKTEKISLSDIAEVTLQTRGSRDKLVILVVEDDLFSRRIVRNSLAGQYIIYEAGDAATAMQQYMTHAPDVTFLDIELPDGNGLELLKKIIKQDKDAYIVMLSGNSFKENVMQAIKDGSKGFVAKPFSKDKLLDYIQKYQTEKSS